MINAAAILAYDFGVAQESYGPREGILYALGLGLGSDPLDRADLRFLDERSLAMLPTFAVTRCTPGMWISDPELGVDFGKLVHSAQWAEFPHAMPPAATVKGMAQVDSLTDRGLGKGAVLVVERTISDAASGVVYCRLLQTLLLRGDGGFGSEPAPREKYLVADREADAVREFATSPRAALIYRLSGDWNPLHFDPDVAVKAGFARPILQGLASYGIAGIAVSRALGRDPADVSELGCRFSGVVVPGEALVFDIWCSGANEAIFFASIGDRKVLDAGRIAWRSPANGS